MQDGIVDECPYNLKEIYHDDQSKTFGISHDGRYAALGQCVDFRLLEKLEKKLKDVNDDKKLETLILILEKK